MLQFQNQRLLSIFIYLSLFVFIFSLGFVLVTDPDFGWHLRYGEEVVVNKRILTIDTFSHALAGVNIIDTEWLTEALYYLIYSRLSFFGLALFSALFTSLAFFIHAIYSSGNLPVRFIYASWAVAGSASVLANGARPQTVSLMFFSFIYLLLLKFIKTQKSLFLYFIPLLFLAWTNAHPGYILGLFLVLIFLLVEVAYLIFPFIKKKNQLNKKYFIKQSILILKLFILLSLSYFSTTLRPYSQNLKIFSLDLVKALALPVNIASGTSSASSVRSTISEWLPPIYIDLPGTLFILAIIVSMALLVNRRFVKTDVRNLILLSAFSYFSTLSRRNAPYFLIIFIPIASLYTRDLVQNIKFKKILMNLFLCGVFIVFVASVMLISKRGRYILTSGSSNTAYCNALNYPCKAIDYLKMNKPRGNMFNHYNWGGYLIWSLRDYPTFIDGRIPGGKIFEEFETVINLKKGWQEVLSRYNISWMIVPRNEIFEFIVKNEDNWKELYADEKAIIMQKI